MIILLHLTIGRLDDCVLVYEDKKFCLKIIRQDYSCFKKKSFFLLNNIFFILFSFSIYIAFNMKSKLLQKVVSPCFRNCLEDEC